MTGKRRGNAGEMVLKEQVVSALRFLAVLIYKHRDRHPNFAVEIKTSEFDEMMLAFGNERVVVTLTKKGDDGVVLQLVNQKTGEALGIEHLMDKDSPAATRMAAALAAFKRAPKLADELHGMLDWRGEPLVVEAIDLLRKLSWEPK